MMTDAVQCAMHFQFDVGSKFFNTQLGMAQSEFNLAQNKEGMRVRQPCLTGRRCKRAGIISMV